MAQIQKSKNQKVKKTWTMADVQAGIVTESGEILKPDDPRTIEKPIEDKKVASGLKAKAPAPEPTITEVDAPATSSEIIVDGEKDADGQPNPPKV